MNAPDVLSLVVAAHVWEATPGIRFNASPNARDALGFRDWLSGVVSVWRDRARRA